MENNNGKLTIFVIDTIRDLTLQQDFVLFVEEKGSKYGYDKFDYDNKYDLESDH